MALGTIEETPCPSRGLEFRGSVVAVPCEHTECRHLGQHLHNRQIQMRVAGGAASRDSFFLWVVLGKKAPRVERCPSGNFCLCLWCSCGSAGAKQSPAEGRILQRRWENEAVSSSPSVLGKEGEPGRVCWCLPASPDVQQAGHAVPAVVRDRQQRDLLETGPGTAGLLPVPGIPGHAAVPPHPTLGAVLRAGSCPCPLLGGLGVQGSRFRFRSLLGCRSVAAAGMSVFWKAECGCCSQLCPCYPPAGRRDPVCSGRSPWGWGPVSVGFAQSLSLPAPQSTPRSRSTGPSSREPRPSSPAPP